MKDYEIYSSLKVPKNLKIILRLDGRRFHKLSKDLNLKKPYDEQFSIAMVEAAKEIFKEFSPLLIYTFSDEFNILLSKVPFSGRVEKLNSVFSSLTSSSMTQNLKNSDNESKNNSYSLNNPISFDSRIIPMADDDILKYFKWRQDESWRNCVNSYGYWTLREKLSKNEATEKMKGYKLSDIHELLFSKGINLNNKPVWEKRGIAIYKKEPVANSNKQNKTLFIDKELPIFNEKFFQRINIL